MPILFAFEALPEAEALFSSAEALGTAAELGTAALGVGEMAGLGAEAFGGAAAGAPGVSQAALEASAASGGAGAGGAGVNAAQVAAQQEAATQATTRGLASVPEPVFQNVGGEGVTQAQTYPVGNGGVTSVPQAMSYDSFGTPALQGSSAATMADPTGLAEMYQSAVAPPPPSALEAGMDKAIKFAEKNPFTAMTGAYMGANALGLLRPTGATFNDKPYDGPLSRYKLSPNFQGSTVNPLDFQYKPRYAEGGGIMGANPTMGITPTVGNNPMMNTGIQVGSGGSIRNYAEGDLVAPPKLAANDPANIPMGNNRLSPVDQYKLIKQDAGLLSGDVTLNNYRGPLPFGTTEAVNNNSVSPQVLKDLQNAAAANLGGDSDVGRFAVPGYGDQGQFFGSSNPLKDDNPYNVDAFAAGGSLSDSIASYQKMLGGQQQAAPAASRDVGIYYDLDPDTRYQDALTAAQIRQAKVNQRAYVSAPVAKRPTPLGKLNMPTSAKSKDSGSSLDPENAAHGGIMHSSLGGYAAGGNPRLLQGPGDGMSDNIPATINGRQPARLADGEFVVPADVVSHLGNGSTEAGAKQLHGMMDKVRKARTGNPKQGKQIKPQKYMPR